MSCSDMSTDTTTPDACSDYRRTYLDTSLPSDVQPRHPTTSPHHHHHLHHQGPARPGASPSTQSRRVTNSKRPDACHPTPNNAHPDACHPTTMDPHVQTQRVIQHTHVQTRCINSSPTNAHPDTSPTTTHPTPNHPRPTTPRVHTRDPPPASTRVTHHPRLDASPTTRVQTRHQPPVSPTARVTNSG
jgi:hypothetical protein